MNISSFFTDISTYIIKHLFPTMLAYCPEFNHYRVSKHYIIASSKPSPSRSLIYLRQSPIMNVAVSISTNKVKNSHSREFNTNHSRLPRNGFLNNDTKVYVLQYLQHLTQNQKHVDHLHFWYKLLV